MSPTAIGPLRCSNVSTARLVGLASAANTPSDKTPPLISVSSKIANDRSLRQAPRHPSKRSNTDNPNHGLIISGSGTVNAGALAIGEKAEAVNKVIHSGLADRDSDDLAARLSELVEQLQKHAAEIPESEDLLAATENVALELAKDQPSKFTVKTLLTGIATGAGPVTSVVEAVQAIQSLL
nr:hypothetical protein Ade03nite_25010 [Actinoplanes derwentensis]